MLDIKVKKLTETAKLPTRGHPADAGYDLYVDSTEEITRPFIHVRHSYNGTKKTEYDVLDMFKVHTGVAVNIPLGYFGRIVPRSSTPGKNLCVHAGTIDAGYTGELIILAWPRYESNSPDPLPWPQTGDRIAQLIIQKHENVNWHETDDLGESERGAAGFGSTGGCSN